MSKPSPVGFKTFSSSSRPKRFKRLEFSERFERLERLVSYAQAIDRPSILTQGGERVEPRRQCAVP